MADIQAFRALRYNLAKVGMLSDVVCPPYDVIDATLQQRLLDMSPYNIVRLELQPELKGDDDNNNRYSRAAQILREWTREDVLVTDTRPAAYLVEQNYKVGDETHTRKGFMARVRLEPFGKGKIYAHEETLSGPKADRLKLYKATSTNLSPVFGLYPDYKNTVMHALEEATRNTLPIEATDHLGVTSRIWAVTDVAAVQAAQSTLSELPVFIADGHHRYETGCKYLEEALEAGEAKDENAPQRFILMMMVSMGDPGLTIMPTHRLVDGLPGIDAKTIVEKLSPYFDIEHVGTGDEAGYTAWQQIVEEGTQDIIALGTRADGNWTLLQLKPEGVAELARRVPEHTAEWRGLGVSILHRLALELLAPQGGLKFRYVHEDIEAVPAAHIRGAEGCDLSALVPACEMDHVAEIASGNEKMPPKSTYFYPKVLSGLVLNPLR